MSRMVQVVSIERDGDGKLIYSTDRALLLGDNLTLRVVGDDLTAERVIPTSRNHTYLRDNTQRAVFDHPAPANYKLEEVAGMSVAEFIESLDLNKK